MNRPLTLHIAYLAISALLITLFGGCRRAPLSSRLTDINILAETAPLSALDSLHTINPDTLSDRDRNYYDFLTVKCERSAHLPITSDSLILKVLKNIDTDKNDAYQAEVLYNAGRVYRDLGDSPSAIEFYYQALNKLPDDKNNQILRAKILTQTGRLLANANLFEEAVQPILDANEILIELKDTLNLISNYQLLGGLYERNRQPEKAEATLREALRLGYTMEPRLNGLTHMYLAVVYTGLGYTQKAINHFQLGFPEVPSKSRNVALAHGARIFRQAGMPDSAFHYAGRLIKSPVEEGKASGYEVLLSPEVRQLIPKDSIEGYYDQYTRLLSRYYNENSNQLMLQQIVSHNYKFQQQRRMEAEGMVRKSNMWVVILACVILIIGYCTLSLKYKRDKESLKLLEARNLLNEIRERIGNEDKASSENSKLKIVAKNTSDAYLQNKETSRLHNEPYKDVPDTDEEELRKVLYAQLQGVYQSVPDTGNESSFPDSEIYAFFESSAKNNQLVPPGSDKWIELEEMVLSITPEFRNYLEILSHQHLREWEYHTLLLIKCGFRSASIGKLVGVGRSGIRNRINILSKNLFGEALSTETLFKLIQLIGF